ncbi:MAG: hypothetical protein GC166_03855 [Alphaproteobacteria bacterium]|nr:hypothetical protein [Alphaproteobacteria bacterium]
MAHEDLWQNEHFRKAFQRWWDEDWSWDGLAEKHNKKSLDYKPNKFLSSLQDVWREEENQKRLIVFADREWTRFHLPPFDREGNPCPPELFSAAKNADCVKKLQNRLQRTGAPDGETIKREGLWAVAQFTDLRGVVLPESFVFDGDSLIADFESAIFMGGLAFGKRVIARFGDATFTGDARFGGATFTGDAGFRGATFTGDAWFGGATFTGDAWFGGATFTGEARFGGATFSGDAWFGGATFTGEARFGDATFSGDAWFGGATFSGYAGFRGATFTGDARFGGATFTGDARFGGATFSGVAWFRGATFTGDARFGDAAFAGVAWFGDATFTGDAWFGGATFTGEARFGDATFTGDAWFGGATFTGEARFGGATFTGEARFGGATFTGDARFGGATFTGDARFDYATFTGDAGFDSATFTGEAWFGSATFTGDAGFCGATFTGVAWIGGATFTGDAGFGGATFARDAGFGGATFTGDARFDSATFTRGAWFDNATFSGNAWFRDATFSGGANFSGTGPFEKRASFEYARFYRGVEFSGRTFRERTEFSKARFHGVPKFHGAKLHPDTRFQNAWFSGESYALPPLSREWFYEALLHRSNQEAIKEERPAARTRLAIWMQGRRRMWDRRGLLGRWKAPRFGGWLFETRRFPELAMVGTARNKDAEEYEIAYRQLRRLCADIGSIEYEGLFHALELKAHRARTDTQIPARIASWLYEMLSDYGRSMARPMLALLNAWFLAVIFYLLLFLPPYDSAGPGMSEAACRAMGSPPGTEIWTAAAREFLPSLFGMSAVANRPEWLRCAEGSHPLLFFTAGVLQILVFIACVSLFLIALRRRFQLRD